MKVIDVSAWQEDISWGDVASEFGGVIVKLGEEKTVDSMCEDHIRNAIANGMKIGVYYYGHAANQEEAAEEAEFVAEKVSRLFGEGVEPELGLWYDVEDEDMQAGDTAAQCNAFLATLADEGYGYAGIYSSYNWLANGIIAMEDLDKDTPIWVAQYNSTNDLAEENPDARIVMWQYTDHYSDDFPYDASEYYEE